MRIHTDKGYWVMNNFVRVRFFKLKREAKTYIEDNDFKDTEYYIKKGTQSYKI